jgi:hypothetical protein
MMPAASRRCLATTRFAGRRSDRWSHRLGKPRSAGPPYRPILRAGRMPRLDTNHRQACFGQRAEQPLRWSSFQSNPLEGLFRTASRASGSLATFTSRVILPASSTMQTLVSLTDTSSPAKWSMLRLGLVSPEGQAGLAANSSCRYQRCRSSRITTTAIGSTPAHYRYYRYSRRVAFQKQHASF